MRTGDNSELNRIEAAVNDAIKYHELTGTVPDCDTVLNHIYGNKYDKTLYYDFAKAEIEAQKHKVAPGTLRNLNKEVSKLHKFRPNLKLIEITPALIQQYGQYLSATLGNKPNTIHKSMQRTAIFLKSAVQQGLINSNPFEGLTFKRNTPQTINALAEIDVQKIESLQGLTPTLEKVQKLFLVQCYTSLSYSDLMSLKAEHITNSNGKQWISKSRIKTDTNALIPLFPKSIELLTQLNFFENGKIKSISNQKYNEYLKILSERADIKERITTHVARKTCGMILLNNGVSMESVSRILGHTSISTTQKWYAKVREQRIIKEIENLGYGQ